MCIASGENSNITKKLFNLRLPGRERGGGTVPNLSPMTHHYRMLSHVARTCQLVYCVYMN